MLQRFVSVSLAILALTASAHAARRVEARRSIAPDGALSIELLAGSVHIVGGSGSEIEVTGSVGDDVEELALEGTERHVRLEVELRDARNLDDVEAELEIRLPKGCEVEIESVGADVTTEGLTGALSIESVHGEARVDAGAREVTVSSVSGTIVVRGSSALRELHLETVSGTVEFTGPLAKNGEYGFESVSGAITLELESAVSASFEISTFGGKIDSDLGPAPRKESSFLPGTTLSFSEGAGDADVSIESFSGTIRIRGK